MKLTPLGHGPGARPLVYAHRGDRSRAPDNTLDAYRLAVEAGADGIELDVRRSKDGVLMLHHEYRDPAIGVFAQMEFEEIRRAAPSVPTLVEALDVIPADVYVNVEIKIRPGDTALEADRSMVEETIAQIREYDEPSRILLSSFDPISMQRAGTAGHEFLRGQLIAIPIPFDVGLQFAREFGVDAFHPGIAYLGDSPEATVQTIRRAGMRTVVWGVNTPDDVSTMAGAGVDAIITDDPGMARNVVDQA